MRKYTPPRHISKFFYAFCIIGQKINFEKSRGMNVSSVEIFRDKSNLHIILRRDICAAPE